MTVKDSYTLAYFKNLCQQGEGQQLEFKRKANNPEKLIIELVAFANSGGGWLLLGVADNGQITGLKDAVSDEFLLRKLIKEHSKPAILIEIHFVKITEARSMLAVHVKDSPKKPHFFLPKDKKRGKAYLRIKDECVEASREMTGFWLRKKRINGSVIAVGPIERAILKQLALREPQTLAELKTTTGMGKKKLSTALITLTSTNVLRILPRPGKADLFQFID